MSPLTWMVAIPAATALGIVFIPADRKGAIRGWSLAGMSAVLGIAIWLLATACGDVGKPVADRTLPLLAQKHPWVAELGISWNVAADGMSVAMLFLTAIVIFAGVLVSWSVQDRTKEFYLSLIALVTGVFGVFASRDLFWIYFFYALAVIPMYLLIGIWGSTNKEYATMKLTLYLTTGAVAALVGLLMVYFKAWQHTGVASFDLDHII